MDRRGSGLADDGPLQAEHEIAEILAVLDAAMAEIDPRPDLEHVAVPTLVLHRSDDAFPDVRHSREYARRIAGARPAHYMRSSRPRART